MYKILAVAVLGAHLAFILWVIFGAVFTRRRKLLAGLHIASLVYAIVIEVAVLSCPLTGLERWAQRKAGLSSYDDDFLTHHLGSLIYPDVPLIVLVPMAVAVCLFNLGVYVWRWRNSRTSGTAA